LSDIFQEIGVSPDLEAGNALFCGQNLPKGKKNNSFGNKKEYSGHTEQRT